MQSFRRINFSRGPQARTPGGASRSGFVLLLVLALIVVAGLVSAGVARRSLLIALEAVKGTDDLQARWARISLQQSVLLQANGILAAEMSRRPAEERARSHFADVEIRLAGRDYFLRIADEEAKANLNTIFHTQGESTVTRTVRELAGESAALPVTLRPFAVGDAAERLPVFDSWGQVFQLAAGSDSTDIPAKLMQATTNMTCWGSGRLNVVRAPENVATLILRPLDQTGLMDRLDQARGARGIRSLTELVEESRRNPRDEVFANAITLQSGCYSLWMRVRDGQSLHHELHIAEQTGNQRADIMSFVW